MWFTARFEVFFKLLNVTKTINIFLAHFRSLYKSFRCYCTSYLQPHPYQNFHWYPLTRWWMQRRIFIFGALGYFNLEGLLEGMSYKLALHVLVTLTKKVVPIHKHVTLFSIPSISGTKTVTITLTKRQWWSYMTTLPLHIYWVPHWPRVIWKMDLGILFHTLYEAINNSQRNKNRTLIVIHFNTSRSFFYVL